MTLAAAQIRAARALLGWNQTELAAASGISVSSVKNLEGGMTEPNPRTIIALRKAFKVAGVILLGPGDVQDGGHGVRLRKTTP